MLSSLQSLLAAVVDYAGLFPPAKLDMAAAAAEYAVKRRDPMAWMLGRFIVPVSRLDELAATGQLPTETAPEPWVLSALASADSVGDRRSIDAFNRAHAMPRAGRAVIEAVETRAATEEEIARAAAAFAGLETYFEIAADSPEELMAAIRRHGGAAKIRTGGVTAEAVPSSATVARFVIAAARAGIPFKATAGLHHPLRGDYHLTYEPDSLAGTMHGFLNVFLAAAFARHRDLGAAEIGQLLEERSAAAFTFVDGAVSWRDLSLDAEALAETRQSFAHSYGSCSFQEPVDDLRALNLLS